MPAGFSSAGLPVGVQLVGRHRGERELLAVAAGIEAMTGLAGRRPEL
jgi:amidase